MIKKFSFVFLSMVLAIVALLIAAKYPTGPNTVSYDDPLGLWMSLGMLAVLFLPPFIFSFFNNLAVIVISAIYQAFIAFCFLLFIPMGFIVPGGGFWISLIGIAGTVVSVCSMLITILSEKKRRMVVS